MGQRYIKAQKRELRRELRKYATGILEYMKPKPAYMPWWLWDVIQDMVIHREKVDPIAKLKGRK